AGNNMAVVAGKELTVIGRGGTAESSVFTGVLMSGSDATFSGITVIGAATSGNTELNGAPLGSGEPKISLTDAKMIHVDDEVNFKFKSPFKGGVGGMGGPGLGFTVSPNSAVNFDLRGKDGSPNGGDPMEISHFFNPETDDFETDWSQWDGFLEYKYDEDTHT